MSMAELWLLWDMRRPRAMYGALYERDVAELHDLLHQDDR